MVMPTFFSILQLTSNCAIQAIWMVFLSNKKPAIHANLLQEFLVKVGMKLQENRS